MATTDEYWPRKDQQMSGFTQACLLFLSEMFAQVEFSHLSKISRHLIWAAAIAVTVLCMTRKSKLITDPCRHISTHAYTCLQNPT